MSTLLKQNGRFEVDILAWNKTVILFRNQLKGQVWFIVTNLSDINQQAGINSYAHRFHIEKFFQDLKSSGFNLEQTKIKKHVRFKRLFFLCCLAYSFLLLLGDLIEEKHPDLKKNSLVSISQPIASFS